MGGRTKREQSSQGPSVFELRMCLRDIQEARPTKVRAVQSPARSQPTPLTGVYQPQRDSVGDNTLPLGEGQQPGGWKFGG
jgi:hypothetical protein